MKKRLILPLGVHTCLEAQKLVTKYRDRLEWFAVGTGLVGWAGYDVFSYIRQVGAKHVIHLAHLLDTPQNVFWAVKAAAKRDLVSMVSVNCAGGVEMMRAAMAASLEAKHEMPSSEPRMSVLGTAWLPTNESGEAPKDLIKTVRRQVEMAVEAGVDGFIVPFDAIETIMEFTNIGFEIAVSCVPADPSAQLIDYIPKWRWVKCYQLLDGQNSLYDQLRVRKLCGP